MLPQVMPTIQIVHIVAQRDTITFRAKEYLSYTLGHNNLRAPVSNCNTAVATDVPQVNGICTCSRWA